MSQAWSENIKKHTFNPSLTSTESIENEEFAIVYHKLIHSPALETLFTLEQKYASDMSSLIAEKNEDIRTIQKRSVAIRTVHGTVQWILRARFWISLC